MVARFIRFYGMSDVEVMEMPARRFFVLHDKISQVMAEEDMRAVMNHHVQNPQERLKDLQKLAGIAHPSTRGKSSDAIIKEVPYAAQREAISGEILAERERQKAAGERLKQEWLAKQQQNQQG